MYNLIIYGIYHVQMATPTENSHMFKESPKSKPNLLPKKSI